MGPVNVSSVDSADSTIPLFRQPGVGRVVVPDKIVELGEVETRGDAVEGDDNNLSRYLLEPSDQLFRSNRVGQDLNAGALDVIPKDAFQDGAVG